MISKDEAKNLGLKIKENENPLFQNLKNNFPQTIKEGEVDLKAIATLLGLKENIAKAHQGYELTFTGKGLANALYNSPCEKELKLDEIYGNEAKNFIVKGDNLDALKILKSAYSGKIKMIYIDPPYNTGSDNFIYPDNFRDDYKEILREVGLIEIDENGKEVESENLKFFKNITSTRTHSGWLCFMLPRLKLARDLLKEDGVIFISIDDNEQANLKLLCDEIFGEDNFVSCFVWRRKTGASDAKGIANITEYILCYIKDNNFINSGFNENTESHDEKRYKLSDEYESRRGKYYIDNLDRGGIHYSDSLNYAIECPDGTITYPNGRREFINDGWVWTWGKEKLKWGLENGFIEFRKSKNKESGWAVCYKNYLFVDNEDKEIKRSAPHKNLILNILNTHATLELNKLIGSKIFDTPKPVNLIKHLLKISTSANQNNEPDIILDFFAGSGTTAQAVMELNNEDGGNREFILVQIDEKIDEKKSKTAYDFCKNELHSQTPTISDITIERVKRAINKIGGDNLGFKVFSLENKAKIINDEKGTLNLMTNANLNAMDKALNLSLQSGKTLDKPIEIVIENKLYKCEDSYFCTACDELVLEYLSKNAKGTSIYIDAYSDIKLEDFLNLNVRTQITAMD